MLNVQLRSQSKLKALIGQQFGFNMIYNTMDGSTCRLFKV